MVSAKFNEIETRDCLRGDPLSLDTQIVGVLKTHEAGN